MVNENVAETRYFYSKSRDLSDDVYMELTSKVGIASKTLSKK